MVTELLPIPRPASPLSSRRSLGPILIVADTEQDALMLKVAMRVAGIANRIIFTTGFAETIDYFFRVTEYSDPSLYPQPGMVLIFTDRLDPTDFGVLNHLESASEISTVVLASDHNGQDARRNRFHYLPRPQKPDDLVDLLRETFAKF